MDKVIDTKELVEKLRVQPMFPRKQLQDQAADRLLELEAEIFRLREHIIDQTKLEQEINQLRKERQAFKDVTEYQKSENEKLTETIKSLNSALTNTSRGNAKLKSAMKNLLWYIGQLEMIAYTNEEGDHEYVEAARAALGEMK